MPAVPVCGRLAHQRVRRIGRQDRTVLADPHIPHRPAAQARVRQVQRHRQRISHVLHHHARVPETARSAGGRATQHGKRTRSGEQGPARPKGGRPLLSNHCQNVNGVTEH